MAEYKCVGGPMNGLTARGLPHYRVGQGFQFDRPHGSEHLDGASYVLAKDGLLHYIQPDSGTQLRRTE